MIVYTEYSANNSGGRWWLDDDDWRALEAAGWRVAWADLEHDFDVSGDYVRDDDGTPRLVPVGEGGGRFSDLMRASIKRDDQGEARYLGALARKAYRVGLGLRDAAEEFERVTGKSTTEAGCPCCGNPHDFTEYDDDGQYVASGPDVEYHCEW